MSGSHETLVGHVRQVLGSSVVVALDEELAGVEPILRGHVHRIGQIGSLVLIPQGPIDLVGTVGMLGIGRGGVDEAETILDQLGDRWLRIELVGEIDRNAGRFRRGVGMYPGLDDPVHFATADDLEAVFPGPGSQSVQIGYSASDAELAICLEADRFVSRHGVVVGSTGSGKTSAVCSLLQAFASNGWDSANIVVIDAHGEYAQALESFGSVRSVMGSGESRLTVPVWALPALEILRILSGDAGYGTSSKRFSELVRDARCSFAADADWVHLTEAEISADSPVPFDVRQVWYSLDRENRETRTVKGDPGTVCLVEEGSAEDLRSAIFEHYGPGGSPPSQAPTYGSHGTLPDRIRLGLSDPRLAFLLEPRPDPSEPEPLERALSEWLGEDSPISILDFSGVSSISADAAVGAVLTILFEVAVRSAESETGIGRASPVLFVLEEAHRFLGSAASEFVKASANRIAREGRKHGLGLLLVSQRPTELPKTAMAQIGTVVALRLTGADDQGAVRAMLPDAVSGLVSALPSLRTGEAIVSGEAIALPLRVRISAPVPRPAADDAALAPWRTPRTEPNLSKALALWRGERNSND